ncbi:hypothetical protein [Fusobacterium sp.]|uniref:hypothetical protein n=1 Tax=Fusobacterium sp. TaxID=68766 RepID=UPI00396C5EB3
MVFYEDFLKKLEEAKYEIKDKETFLIEGKKMISILGIGIALLLIGAYQGYVGFLAGGKIPRGIFGIVLILLGFKQLKVIFMYKMSIDVKNKILISEKIKVDLSKVESCTLKEQKVGKHLETVVDIITENKEQFIIPFYMNKKVKFAYILKNILKDRFIIKSN